ncbi:MAG: DUF1761 family protein [Alphaproteobacteria bacterium]|nr:DUF1761 family protein [Alphaproteobacteria bacterium]
MIIEVIFLSIAGTVLSIVIGSLWHAPFWWAGKLHMEYTGFAALSKTEQKKAIKKAKKYMWKIYLIQAFLSLITSAFIAFVVAQTATVKAVSVYAPFLYVVAIWFCFIFPIITGSFLWGREITKKMGVQKVIADSLHYLISFALVTAMCILYFNWSVIIN